MAASTNVDICARIAQVRREVAGPRGRAAFAQRLGIAASTYQNYETSRIPPAAVLVKIAEAAGVDLRWLLTGQAGTQARVPAGDPVLHRAAQLLDRHPDAAGPLAAFLDILAASLGFPHEKAAAGPAAALTVAPAAGETQAAPADEAPCQPPDTWLPVLGRSAAGVPHFWATSDDAAGVSLLGDLIERHARRPGRTSRPGIASLDEEAGDWPVQVITLSEPVGGEVAEFIAAPSIKARYGDAFALRIDGDSMAPEIRHSDLVILSPSAHAAHGKAAVVQLERQIGVTCKLYRREGDKVHLIPINEAFSPQSFPAAQVVWALRVLARVRARSI
jgi:phage repressor protein C with HTH and peptisase S24 domain